MRGLDYDSKDLTREIECSITSTCPQQKSLTSQHFCPFLTYLLVLREGGGRKEGKRGRGGLGGEERETLAPVAQYIGVSACTPKGQGFKSRSGHLPRLQTLIPIQQSYQR